MLSFFGTTSFAGAVEALGSIFRFATLSIIRVFGTAETRLAGVDDIRQQQN